MSARNPAYLHQNRHGTFSVRWRPPAPLTSSFDQREYAFSLATKDRAVAFRCARRVVLRIDAVASLLLGMKPKHRRLVTTGLIRRLVTPAGGVHEVDYDPAKPEEAAEAKRIFEELMAGGAMSPAEGQLLERVLQPSLLPAAPPAADSPVISKAFHLFCAEKRQSKEWKDPDSLERYDYGPVVELLIDIAGDRTIRTLSDEHMRGFKRRVVEAKSASATIKKKMNRLGTFLRWAFAEGYLATDLTKVARAPKRKGDAKHYEAFSGADLKKLFESASYRAQEFKKASEFWIPMLGLYTGARINELAQLHLDDIGEQAGVPVISINDEGVKSVKAKASRRTVPLHPRLMEAGFLDFVAVVRGEGWIRLFPELTKSGRAKDSYGKDPSRHFTAYRRKCLVAENANRTKVFHSFRTTANSTLRFSGVPLEHRERLIGHESSAINNSTYSPADRDLMFPIATLREQLALLDFGLEHPKYEAKDEHRLARLKAARARRKKHRAEPGDGDAVAAAGKSIASLPMGAAALTAAPAASLPMGVVG